MLIRRLDHKSLFAGAIAALVVVAGVWLGSQRLKHFDPALIWYATGSVLAAFAVAYRFAVWAQRPPSRLYFKRGLELFFKHHGTSVPRITPHVSRRNALTFQRVNDFTPASGGWTAVRAFATGFVAQNFIRRRSVYRWIMHLCLSGGCTLAFAITFPLVFGWVHFEPSGDNAEIYRVNLLGFDAGSFGVRGALAFVVFNLLNLCAVAVTAGLVMAAIRRCVNAGERAVQTFSGDILPLLLIFFVTSTGLMLTVSYRFMAGRGHSAVAVAHAASVIALLFYLPFGKLFHLFQRACGLCVSLYKAAGATGPQAHCHGCGDGFASQMHLDDLKEVLDQLGFNYRFATSRGEVHYQDICPACRRRLLALSQGKTLGR
ncbi:MAG TPA: hypothetical protein VEL06_12075 [Haliangiales bacterium]|nr:hypothetical protein [Haliangiales bacterium]